MVDVVEMQECLMSELAESLEVIVLVFYPVRVHLPQHPLACHLEKAAASPCVANGVGGYLQLEAVAKLMRKAVELAVLYTVGRHPQCTDEIVVSASVGRTLKAVVQHDHHLVTVGLAAGKGETERIAEIAVEMLHARLKVRQVHTHIVAIKLRSTGKVVAKSFLPKEHEVVGLGRTLPTPPRGCVVEIINAQGVWQEDCLLCPGRLGKGQEEG